MACALTQGFTLGCKEDIGGIKSVRFAAYADYIAMNASVTTGAIVSFSAATASFRKYELTKEESMFSDDPTAGNRNGSLHYVPSLTFVLRKLDVAKRNEMQLLAKNRVVAIIETNEATPQYWVAGYANGLDFASGTGATGTAFADLNGYTMTFNGLEPNPMLSIPSSLLASITA
jgi:hypothetical protein